MEREYTSNLHCTSCVNTLAPHFDGEEKIDFWSVDLEDPKHVITVEGDISPAEVQALAKKAGYEVALRG
ncbi:MAG TPA: hypothetical protein DCE41_35905 [Cytophagales bacterium]|nr:hypothetical protein [Cytophagales bacterium]HAA18310.1 hypothetical protein [Cytophagales bacterium]HAP63870.1 hypothetical protein [Cytophagales bacterium]